MHDTSLDALPDVHEAALDADGVRRVLGDIDACATLHSIIVKRGALEHADQQPKTLHAAARELFDGSARAIQLRYEHRGQHWTDTILRLGNGYRLVRVAAPEALTLG
jgi:hypothetical protein